VIFLSECSEICIYGYIQILIARVYLGHARVKGMKFDNTLDLFLLPFCIFIELP
jgi:hypothetical protein